MLFSRSFIKSRNMIIANIYLPDLSHYQLVDIAREIANQKPSAPNNATGLDCLCKKLIAPFRLDSEPLYLFRVKDFTIKSELTDDDKKILKTMLMELPIVSHFMSIEEIELFYEQYYKIPNRPTWEPEITSPSDRSAMKLDYDRRVKEYCEDFLSIVKTGIGRVLDKNFNFLSIHKLTNDLSKEAAYVTKEDAIKICNQIGIDLLFKDSAYISKDLNLKTSTRSDKRDLLTQAIENYQKQFANNWTPQSMWLAFSEMAKKKTPPFTKHEGNLLFWTDDGGRPHHQSLRALKARLDRQK